MHFSLKTIPQLHGASLIYTLCSIHGKINTRRAKYFHPLTNQLMSNHAAHFNHFICKLNTRLGRSEEKKSQNNMKLAHIFRVYMENSSLHGANFIVDQKNHLLERFAKLPIHFVIPPIFRSIFTEFSGSFV